MGITAARDRVASRRECQISWEASEESYLKWSQDHYRFSASKKQIANLKVLFNESAEDGEL